MLFDLEKPDFSVRFTQASDDGKELRWIVDQILGCIDSYYNVYDALDGRACIYLKTKINNYPAGDQKREMAYHACLLEDEVAKFGTCKSTLFNIYKSTTALQPGGERAAKRLLHVDPTMFVDARKLALRGKNARELAPILNQIKYYEKSMVEYMTKAKKELSIIHGILTGRQLSGGWNIQLP